MNFEFTASTRVSKKRTGRFQKPSCHAAKSGVWQEIQGLSNPLLEGGGVITACLSVCVRWPGICRCQAVHAGSVRALHGQLMRGVQAAQADVEEHGNQHQGQDGNGQHGGSP